MNFSLYIILILCFCSVLAFVFYKRAHLTDNAHAKELPERIDVREAVIRSYLPQTAILVNLKSTDRDGVLHEMLAHVEPQALGISKDVAFHALCQREADMPTCIGEAIACPHARFKELQTLVPIIELTSQPIAFSNQPEGRCRIILLTLIPLAPNSPYMSFISALLTRLASPSRRQALLAAPSATAVRKVLLS
jgi:mannitol/fructose-specific phosphotransferase system IIA component (Ntr-type)